MTISPPASVPPRLGESTRGAIYVEFLIAFIPVLIFFLGLLQLALIYSAHLVVRHAAWRAARTAVVVLEDDPELYGGADRRAVSYEGNSSEEDTQSSLSGIAEGVGLQGVSDFVSFDSSPGGARLNSIRRAAYMPLSVLAPSLERLTRAFHLDLGIGRLGNGGRFLGGLLLYNRAAAMLTLRDENDEVAHTVDSNGMVKVRLTYLYNCGLPIVSAIMCESIGELTGFTRTQRAVQRVMDEVRQGDILEAIRQGQAARDELQAAREDFNSFKEQMGYAQNPELLIPFAYSNGFFKVMEAEAMLPNQGACYYEGSSCYDP